VENRLITTLLFDFDGTIADTYPIIFYSFKTIFKEFKGQDVTDQFIFQKFGPAESEIIRTNFADLKNTDSVLQRYYEVYDQHHARLTPPRPQLVRVLKVFKQRGFRLGVVTGKGRRSLDISLGHLFPANLFDVSVAGDEIARPKPHPEGLEKALAALKADPTEAVFIGDTDADFLAGRALNMATIGVRWFHAIGSVDWKEKPDAVFHDVPSFEKYILSPEFGKA
jgi:pyrophosphatase PpaX